MVDRLLRRIFIGGALAVLCAALVGVLVGHFVWGGASVLRLMPSPHRSFGAYEYPHSYGGRYREGVYGEEGQYESSEGSSSSGAGVSSSITSKVDPALVDINTTLGLEGGAAAGTGMVVTSDGEVITNNHVITGATSITATDVGNGRTYTARVIGYDYGHDIAVLQLEGASGLQSVSLGNSSSAQTGQTVATLGNAGGANGTPSAAGGRIAALGQAITAGDQIDGTEEHLTNMIEIEGDLQPGDSGGPLVNSSGEVIGMDTAASQTFQFRSSAHQGFAIPIEEVRSVAAAILAKEAAGTLHIGATGFLGVMIEAQSTVNGAVVQNVIAGTPAAGSGLAAGDIITEIDGSNVSSPTTLSHLILQHHPGEQITVSWQAPTGASSTATVTLAQGPPQ